MRTHLEQRLAELKSQFAHGRKVLSDLEVQQARLRETLLRISGAIEVLEEELGTAQSRSGDLGAEATAGGADTSHTQIMDDDRLPVAATS